MMNTEKSGAGNGDVEPANLGAMDELVSEFERLLASEQHLLKSGQAEGIEVIASAKQQIIDQLASQETVLVSMFQQFVKHESVAQLKERLLQCRINNKNNHSLVLLELKHTKKSLELLRSMLMMDDLSLYCQRGQVDVRREKRRFGSA